MARIVNHGSIKVRSFGAAALLDILDEDAGV